MARHLLSRLADLDVQGIWLHVADDSVESADRLMVRFTRAFELLARNPELGQQQDHLRSGLRRFVVGRYLVFYLRQDEDIVVVRVLHGARDIGQGSFH